MISDKVDQLKNQLSFLVICIFLSRTDKSGKSKNSSPEADNNQRTDQ
jgi:hypothetical protein